MGWMIIIHGVNDKDLGGWSGLVARGGLGGLGMTMVLGPGRGRRDEEGLGAECGGWFDTGLRKTPARLTTNG